MGGATESDPSLPPSPDSPANKTEEQASMKPPSQPEAAKSKMHACKSSPPYRVPDLSLVAPSPKSPPCKASNQSVSRDRPRAKTAVESFVSAEKSPRRTIRTTSLDGIESPEKARGNRETSDDPAAWLPEHAQKLVKRHLGDSFFTPRGAQVNEAPSDVGIVDSADVAGGIAADDAAAGDAAVLALVAGKCAPAACGDLPHLAEILGTPAKNEPDRSPASSMESRAQFFNIWESDPDCEEAERVHQWLRKLGLGRYFELLAAEGFDDMNILAHLEEKQIADLMELCPMPSLHEQQLRRGLTRLRTDGNLDLSQVSAV